MSGAKVEFTPEALWEIDDAFEWYFERNQRAVESHKAELDSRLADLEENPNAGSPWEEVRAQL